MNPPLPVWSWIGPVLLVNTLHLSCTWLSCSQWQKVLWEPQPNSQLKPYVGNSSAGGKEETETSRETHIWSFRSERSLIPAWKARFIQFNVYLKILGKPRHPGLPRNARDAQACSITFSDFFFFGSSSKKDYGLPVNLVHKISRKVTFQSMYYYICSILPISTIFNIKDTLLLRIVI